MLQPQLLYAKKIFPSDIMGRALDYPPPIRWAGHVGIATRSMYDSSGMSIPANLVIEILNEPIIGQINNISDFKARSKYWGSRYGAISSPEQGYRALVEANHQRWWVNEYTSNSDDYIIGEGNPNDGQIFKHGKWRCDTYAWWAFYSQGIDLVPGHVMLPAKVFNAFPYGNDERISKESKKIASSSGAYFPEFDKNRAARVDLAYKKQFTTEYKQADGNKTLNDVTPEEINQMSAQEFQSIMHATLNANDSGMSSSPSVYMSLAYNEKLSDFVRGIMIDRITMRATETDLVQKLLKLYDETDSMEVKAKIISGLMSYNETKLVENTKYHPKDVELLKNFFYQLINEKPNLRSSVHIVSGFIYSHSADDIMQNIDKIDNHLASMIHQYSVITKYSLIFKSHQLQNIYIKSILEELRTINSADVDDYFFGPLSIGYNGSGKDLLLPENTQLIIDYLKEVHYKYTNKGIKKGTKTDKNRSITSIDYHNLIKAMGIKLLDN